MFNVPEKYRITKHKHAYMNTTKEDGNNGYFAIKQRYTRHPALFFIQASDGMGWEHVSVSMPLSLRTPTWEEMCYVKDLFWDLEDTVVQYHPAQSEYVNLAKNCLHLWRPIGKELLVPNAIFVGPQQNVKDHD